MDNPNHHAPLLDKQAIEAARSQLNENFRPLMEYFMRDTARHIRRMERAIASEKIVGLLPPAHTAKSASRQLGLKRLGEIAADLERDARHALDEPCGIENFSAQVRRLKSTFEETCLALNDAL